MTFRRMINWLIMVLLFALCLSISAAPRFFDAFAPLSFLPLICLYSAVIFAADDFPLWLLFIFGLLMDSIQGATLGSSSLLFALITPYIQLMSQSALRFSLMRVWLLFIGFLLLYLTGQAAISFLLGQENFPDQALALNTTAAILLFPLIFGIVLWLNNRLNRNMMTPL